MDDLMVMVNAVLISEFFLKYDIFFYKNICIIVLILNCIIKIYYFLTKKLQRKKSKILLSSLKLIYRNYKLL